MSEKELGQGFDWEDEIENDGSDFEALPAGDYDFEVQQVERGWFDGSEKMAACNKAVVSIRISGAAGATTITHNFFLNSKAEWKICEFYTAIGFRKKGEKLKMAWGRITGEKGRCKVGVRTWKHKTTGEDMQSNEILKFYEPAESKPAEQPTQQSSWTPGNF